MASPAQIAANRRNALKSTGPRTLRGKSFSRLNATRHGAFSLLQALTPEQNAQVERARLACLAEYPGAAPEHHELIAELAFAAWRVWDLSRRELFALCNPDMLSSATGEISRALVRADRDLSRLRLLTNKKIGIEANLCFIYTTAEIAVPAAPARPTTPPAPAKKQNVGNEANSAPAFNTVIPAARRVQAPSPL